jgi:hypothetical protein
MDTKSLMVAVVAVVMATPLAAGAAEQSLASQCAYGIKQGYKELDIAKVNGLGGTVEYSKAATLLTGAKIQQQFHKYPNCVDKTTRARRFIRESKK